MNMKRVMAVLLAVLMLCGVGAVGVSASWTSDPVVQRRVAMDHSYSLLSNWPLGNENLIEALNNGKNLEDFFEDMLAVRTSYMGKIYFDLEGNWHFYSILEISVDYDAVLAEYFSSAFVEEFKAWQAALVNRRLAYAELLEFLGYGDGSPSNPYKDAVEDDYDERYRIPFEEDGSLTLAQAAVVLQELEIEIRALIDELDTPTEPEQTPFWNKWPGWLVWILRNIFFGWIWIN